MSGANGPRAITVLPGHVRVDLDSVACEAWRSCADVLYGTGSPERAVEVARRHVGCQVVSLRDPDDGCCAFVLRGGRLCDGQLFQARTRVPVRSAEEHGRLTSLVYESLLALTARRACAGGPGAAERPEG